MPKGIKHKDIGTELTYAEYHGEDHHDLASGISFPASPIEKQLFYRTDLHKWFIYRGDSWRDVTEGKTADAVVGAKEYFTTIQSAIDSGILDIFLKNETFEISDSAGILPSKDGTIIRASGVGNVGEVTDCAIVKATATMTRLLDLRARKFCHVQGFEMHGDGKADVCIDAHQSVSACALHKILDMNVHAAVERNIDLTGAEDTIVGLQSKIEGRKVHTDTSPTTKYGIVTGTDGHGTTGIIRLGHIILGNHGYGDIWFKALSSIKSFGTVCCSRKSIDSWSAPNLKANIILDGAVTTLRGDFYGLWCETGPDIPNVLIENNAIQRLSINGTQMMADASENIYSALNPAALTLAIRDITLDTSGGTKYNIKVPCTFLTVENLEAYGSVGEVDVTNVSKYWIRTKENKLITNYDLKMKGGAFITDVDPFMFYHEVNGASFQWYDSGAGKGIMEIDKNVINIFGSVLTDPKNHADATLGGTPKVVEVNIGGVPHYFKVKPNKS